MKHLLLILVFTTLSYAQGTQVWQQSTYEDFSKGTSHGVSISSDGTLTPAPALKTIFESPSAYIWGLAVDKDGTAYLAAGQPSRVYRVTPDGKATIVLAPNELAVQAVALAPDGTIYAATSPDGKIYKIVRNHSSSATAQSKTDTNSNVASPIPNDINYTSSVFFDPKAKYIWSLTVDKDGNVFAATGDSGELFKINSKGEGSVWFKSDDAHIRSMLLASDGTIYAGTDSSGLIYHITSNKEGKGDGFVLYSANKKEVTALALDDKGTLYAAAVGDKKLSPTFGAFGNNPVVNFGNQPQPPANTSIAPPPAPFTQTGGSEVYRFPKDGAPEKLWSSKDEIVYALTQFMGTTYIYTGNKGRVIGVTTQSIQEVVKLQAQQVTAVNDKANKNIYLVSSNPGRLYMSDLSSEKNATFESEIFDARTFTQWGRIESRGDEKIELWVRSGNVENPERNWSPWQKMPSAASTKIDVPATRYLQWKATFPNTQQPAKLESIKIYYLTRNVAPVVDDVVVQTNAKVNVANVIKQPETVNINLTPAPGTPPPPVITKFELPLNAQKERGSVTVRWAAHDDNDDQLVYTVLVRGTDDKRWLPLKDHLTEKYYSFDASTLPDGAYFIRVIASDSPSHTPSESLSGQRDSALFEIDTTPPRVEGIEIYFDRDNVFLSFTAKDDYSTIQRTEYSIDAGEWHLIEPVGKISDSKIEKYSAVVGTKQSLNMLKSDEQHIFIVRVFDRFENMGTAKYVYDKNSFYKQFN